MSRRSTPMSPDLALFRHTFPPFTSTPSSKVNLPCAFCASWSFSLSAEHVSPKVPRTLTWVGLLLGNGTYGCAWIPSIWVLGPSVSSDLWDTRFCRLRRLQLLLESSCLCCQGNSQVLHAPDIFYSFWV